MRTVPSWWGAAPCQRHPQKHYQGQHTDKCAQKCHMAAAPILLNIPAGKWCWGHTAGKLWLFLRGTGSFAGLLFWGSMGKGWWRCWGRKVLSSCGRGYIGPGQLLCSIIWLIFSSRKWSTFISRRICAYSKGPCLEVDLTLITKSLEDTKIGSLKSYQQEASLNHSKLIILYIITH